MRVIFTCGGTAGHVNPALALAGYMKEKDQETAVLFVGTPTGMERELVAKTIAADDVVAELAAEVKRLLALNEALNRRIDSLLNEKADAIQWMKKFEAQNRRLLKEVESLKKGGAQ